jgi:hypothetical protein
MESLAKAGALATAEMEHLTGATEDLVPAEKAYIELLNSPAWKTFTQKQKETVQLRAAEIGEQQKQIKTFEKLAEAAGDYADKVRKEQDDYVKQQSDIKEKADEYVRTLEAESAAQMQSNTQREVAVALLKLEATGITEADVRYKEYVDRITEAVRAREAFAANQKMLADQAAEYKRTYEQISDTITDALMRGFEGGKSIVKNFIATTKNMFASMVLRPGVQNLVGGVGANFGIPGAASAAPTGISSLVGQGAQSLGINDNVGIGGRRRIAFGAGEFTAALAGDAFLPAHSSSGYRCRRVGCRIGHRSRSCRTAASAWRHSRHSSC